MANWSSISLAVSQSRMTRTGAVVRICSPLPSRLTSAVTEGYPAARCCERVRSRAKGDAPGTLDGFILRPSPQKMADTRLDTRHMLLYLDAITIYRDSCNAYFFIEGVTNLVDRRSILDRETSHPRGDERGPHRGGHGHERDDWFEGRDERGRGRRG